MVNGISSTLIENFANFDNFNDNNDEPKDTEFTDNNNNNNNDSDSDEMIKQQNRAFKKMLNEKYGDTSGQGTGGGEAKDNLPTTTTKNVSKDTPGQGTGGGLAQNNIDEDVDEDEGEVEGEYEGERPQSSHGDGTGSNDITDSEEFDGEEDMEEFGALDKPIYEGFTNSDFNASNIVRGRNLHNLLKALLISLVLCSLNHKDVSKMVVDPLVRLVHNKLSHSTMVCVLVFVVSYLVIAFL